MEVWLALDVTCQIALESSYLLISVISWRISNTKLFIPFYTGSEAGKPYCHVYPEPVEDTRSAAPTRLMCVRWESDGVPTTGVVWPWKKHLWTTWNRREINDQVTVHTQKTSTKKEQAQPLLKWIDWNVASSAHLFVPVHSCEISGPSQYCELTNIKNLICGPAMPLKASPTFGVSNSHTVGRGYDEN